VVRVKRFKVNNLNNSARDDQEAYEEFLLLTVIGTSRFKSKVTVSKNKITVFGR
jgi:hypothetical protein